MKKIQKNRPAAPKSNPSREDTRRPSRPPQEDARKPARSTQEGARKPSRPSQEDARRPARSTQDGARKPSRPAQDDTRKPSRPSQDDALKPARSTQDDTRKTAGPQDGGRSPREGQKARRSHQTGREGLFINNWSALGEYLRAQPDALQKIFHAPREAKRIHQLLSEHGVTLSCEEDQEMETGFAAKVTVQYKDEEQLLREAAARTEDLIIACDHVTDTRNLGAIARTAAFFGLSTILMPKDRQAPITSATLGTAQGAFATVAPTEVTNLGRTLLALKECGYWIAAADMVGTPVDKMPTRYEKLVLVLGSEDKGVAAQILNKSDFTLSIPSYGGKLESLNVSVAAGILIHALRAAHASGKILPQG